MADSLHARETTQYSCCTAHLAVARHSRPKPSLRCFTCRSMCLPRQVSFSICAVGTLEYFIQTQVVTAGDLGINAQEVEQNLSQVQRLDSLQCGQHNARCLTMRSRCAS